MPVMEPLARAGVAGHCPDIPAARTAGKHKTQKTATLLGLLC